MKKFGHWSRLVQKFALKLNWIIIHGFLANKYFQPKSFFWIHFVVFWSYSICLVFDTSNKNRKPGSSNVEMLGLSGQPFKFLGFWLSLFSLNIYVMGKKLKHISLDTSSVKSLLYALISLIFTKTLFHYHLPPCVITRVVWEWGGVLRGGRVGSHGWSRSVCKFAHKTILVGNFMCQSEAWYWVPVRLPVWHTTG